METKEEKIIKIDLQAVVEERLPRASRFIPKVLVKRLARLICQDEMNALLRSNAGRRDGEFCRGVMEELGVSLNVGGCIPSPDNRRVIIVSNHPLGGLDGIAIIDWMTRHYGGQFHFVVNDLLMAIEPLRGVFLPVNKHGRQSREGMRDFDEAMAGDDPVVIFPAGLVSRMRPDGSIADLEWRKMFVSKALQYGRDVVPAFFDGKNSMSFYKFARRREKFGLKFNIEMVLLPREVFRCRGASFSLTFGHVISCDKLRAWGRDATSKVRDIVYSLTEKA